MVETRKMGFCLFLALVLLISLSAVVFGAIPLTAYRDEKIKKKISFENIGKETCYNVWAEPEGDAKGWVKPDKLEFGTVGPGETSDPQEFTIEVPEDAEFFPQEYDLIWYYYAQHPLTGAPLDTGARASFRIRVVPGEPDPEPEPEPDPWWVEVFLDYWSWVGFGLAIVGILIAIGLVGRHRASGRELEAENLQNDLKKE